MSNQARDHRGRFAPQGRSVRAAQAPMVAVEADQLSATAEVDAYVAEVASTAPAELTGRARARHTIDQVEAWAAGRPDLLDAFADGDLDPLNAVRARAGYALTAA